MITNTSKIALGLLLVAACLTGAASADDGLGSLMVKKEALAKEIEAVNKEYEPKLQPLQKQLQEIRNEIQEKTQKKNEQKRELEKLIADGFKKLMPSGKQSYGDFTWDCYAGSWINVSAKDGAGKQAVWAQVFYYPEITEEEQKAYGSKTCCGYPAKRYTDKWVWIQCGKTEIRFGLSDKTLETDAILNAIVGSFDLAAISKL